MRCGPIVRRSVQKKLNISKATRTPSKTFFVGCKDAEGNLLNAGAKEEVGLKECSKYVLFQPSLCTCGILIIALDYSK